MTDSKTIFSQILDGDISSQFIYENEDFFVIKDINPKAPTHLLIISKEPIKTLNDVIGDSGVSHKLVPTIQEVAKLLEEPQYRVQINCGEKSGQEIFHLHVHLLSNSKLKSIA